MLIEKIKAEAGTWITTGANCEAVIFLLLVPGCTLCNLFLYQ